MDNSHPTLVSIGDAAHFLGVSKATLRRWEQDGVISCGRTAGGHRRFSLERLKKLQSSMSEIKGITFK